MRRRTFAFICGCGHSGTSLLANMFAAHADVYVPLRETGTFLGRLAWMRLIRLKVALYLSGRRHLVEKTPRHVRVLDRLRRMVPGARIIFLVRDGRDVAASFVKRHGSAKSGAARWVADNAIVAEEAEAGDTIVVRYEDLIRQPRQELERICAFVGLPFSDAMLDYHRQKRLWFGEKKLHKSGDLAKNHTALRNWQINQPLFDGHGKWREVLSEDDLTCFRSGKAKELMALFGYESGA